MNWFEKLIPNRVDDADKNKTGVPEGLWTKCPACEAMLYQRDLEKNLNVCTKCNHHLRIRARKRLQHFLDTDAPQEEIGADLESQDLLKFKDTQRYKERLLAAQKKTGEKNALLVIRGKLQGLDVVAVAFEFAFLGGSMGAAVGERFVQAVNACLEHQLPLICFSASGGARMQEALVSLMQMAKTSAALARLSEAGLPYISVLTDPTTGGVSASLAMLGDIIIAEPGAVIGFAGPRVIQQIVKQTLPEGFQTSEFLLAHGAIDMVVSRNDMRPVIARTLGKLMRQPYVAADAVA